MSEDHAQGRGCDECINGWYEGKTGSSLYEHRAALISLQRDLYTCAQCGTWWDFPPLSRPWVISAADAQAMIDGTWTP